MAHKMKEQDRLWLSLSETGGPIKLASRDGQTDELKALIDGLASYLDSIRID
jgi:hypothetical protein